jgi:GT2 family glycosyltransferase
LTVTVEHAPLQKLLGDALAAARRSDRRLTPEFRRLAQPLVAAAPPQPQVSEVYVVEPACNGPAASPRASIVVPFYGDDFYLLDHIMAQSRAPVDVEWILVCDDPRLSGALRRTLDERRCLVRQSTTLLILGANGGFAHANNIGASHAHGTYLLLMNSDVYCRDFDFLDRAITLMEGDAKIGCVGFSMQFEDGTVQHDGMRFERAPWFDGLWASEHPGKGLPPSASSEAAVEAEAVTAA